MFKYAKPVLLLISAGLIACGLYSAANNQDNEEDESSSLLNRPLHRRRRLWL